jgi:hypothetical protein
MIYAAMFALARQAGIRREADEAPPSSCASGRAL